MFTPSDRPDRPRKNFLGFRENSTFRQRDLGYHGVRGLAKDDLTISRPPSGKAAAVQPSRSPLHQARQCIVELTALVAALDRPIAACLHLWHLGR